MMLSVFSNLLAKESDLRVIDNLCAALCRMIMSNVDAVPLEQACSHFTPPVKLIFNITMNLYSLQTQPITKIWRFCVDYSVRMTRLCSLIGCTCSGGPSSTERRHGGEQDSVQMPGYALHTQSCSGTVHNPFFDTSPAQNNMC